MTSSILSYLLTYPTIPLAVAFAITLLYTAYLHHKIYRFTRGQNGASLESLMKSCVDSVAEIEKRNEVISSHALSLNERLSHAVRNAQTIRYKAFEINGSNQSFSIAFLNEHGNGVTLTSLHARDRISTFAKPVENYTSTYDLTEEELFVINEAKASHKKPTTEDKQ
jgi:hypothetical protein